MSFTAVRSSASSRAHIASSFDLPPAYSDSTYSGPSRSFRYLPDDPSNYDEDAFLPSPVTARPGTAEDADDTDVIPAVVTDLPPTYTPFDERPKIFSFCESIINTVSADGMMKPRYQLKSQSSQSGRLWRLQLRRLLPSESRRLSMSAYELSIEFDTDTMLYEVENLAALYSFRNRLDVQIKGRKAGTLPGHIELSSTGRDGHEFKHCTRPAAKHWSREENIRKMNKWGWNADMELEKTSLFSCRSIGRRGKAEWKQRDDLTDEVFVVAVEMNGELVLRRDISERTRDVLVTCWAAKHWSMGTLDAGKPPDVKLSRWLTVG